MRMEEHNDMLISMIYLEQWQWIRMIFNFLISNFKWQEIIIKKIFFINNDAEREDK
jgi:hypothetical protein